MSLWIASKVPADFPNSIKAAAYPAAAVLFAMLTTALFPALLPLPEAFPASVLLEASLPMAEYLREAIGADRWALPTLREQLLDSATTPRSQIRAEAAVACERACILLDRGGTGKRNAGTVDQGSRGRPLTR